MSTLIPISILSDEHLKIIQKDLSVVPIDKEEEQRKKFQFGKSKIPSKPKEIIPMFQIDYFNDVPYIRIPYRYACDFFKQPINRHVDPSTGKSVYPVVDYNFKAELRPHQVSVASEAYNQLATYGTTTLCLPTGFGKTLLSLYLAGLTKSLIAVNITLAALTDSWKTTFLKCYPDMIDRIWIVGENEMPKDPAVIIFMYTRYEKIPLEIRSKIGCLLLDEAHLHCTVGRVPALLSITPKYTIALSATLERNDGLEQMIYKVVGEHNVERLSENPFTMIKLNTGIKIEEEKTAIGVNYSKFVSDQGNNRDRNIQIVNIINANLHKKFMVFTKTKEHVEKLEELFKSSGIDCATYFGNKKKFVDKKVLIGSIAKIGTGFDQSNVAQDFDGLNADVLILTTTVKNHNLLRQVFGRVLGRASNPTIIYMIDQNNTQKRHFAGAKKMIENTHGKIYDINYNPSEIGGGVKLT